MLNSLLIYKYYKNYTVELIKLDNKKININTIIKEIDELINKYGNKA